MYSSAVLIAVALISGYLYITQTEAERYKFKRAAGWHCYFHVAAWGIFFIVLGWLICVAGSFFGLPAFAQNIKSFLAEHSPTRGKIIQGSEINFLIFCAAALLLPFLWCKILRPLGYKISDIFRCVLCRPCCVNTDSLTVQQLKEQRKEKALRVVVKDSPFEKIITEASLDDSILFFSLSSRKFYVGRIAEIPAFSNGKIEYIQFIPFFSGYRDKETLKTINTTDYMAVFSYYNALIKNEKIIPAEKIEDISFFDFDIYEKFHAKETEPPPVGVQHKIAQIFKITFSVRK